MGISFRELSGKRIDKMMNAPSEKEAIYMGRFDRFKDVFRGIFSTKKSDQLKRIYADLVKPFKQDVSKLFPQKNNDIANKFKCFADLSLCAKPGLDRSFIIGLRQLNELPEVVFKVQT